MIPGTPGHGRRPAAGEDGACMYPSGVLQSGSDVCAPAGACCGPAPAGGRNDEG